VVAEATAAVTAAEETEAETERRWKAKPGRNGYEKRQM